MAKLEAQEAEKAWQDQPRVPAGNPDGGQWTDEGGGSGAGAANADGADAGYSGGLLHLTGGRGGARGGGRSKPATTNEEERRLRNESETEVRSGLAKEARFNELAAAATPLRKELQKLDPKWKGPVSALDPNSLDGRIKHLEVWNQAADKRMKELSTIPGTNSGWGVNRLTRELYANGYRLERQADKPGLLYRNSRTSEEVRIMQKPPNKIGRRSSRKIRERLLLPIPTRRRQT